PRVNWAPAASATLSATSAVIGSRLAVPRMPSVPKSLRVMEEDYTRIRGGRKATRNARAAGCRQRAYKRSARPAVGAGAEQDRRIDREEQGKGCDPARRGGGQQRHLDIRQHGGGDA